MFQRLVRVADQEVWVSCTPDTPLWEVLACAARQLRRAAAKEPGK